MPVQHESRRDVTDNEARLWAAVRERSEHGSLVNTTRIARNTLPMHESRARQVVRTWANEGLVEIPGDDANKVALTDYGRRVEDLVSTL